MVEQSVFLVLIFLSLQLKKEISLWSIEVTTKNATLVGNNSKSLEARGRTSQGEWHWQKTWAAVLKKGENRSYCRENASTKPKYNTGDYITRETQMHYHTRTELSGGVVESEPVFYGDWWQVRLHNENQSCHISWKTSLRTQHKKHNQPDKTKATEPQNSRADLTRRRRALSESNCSLFSSCSARHIGNVRPMLSRPFLYPTTFMPMTVVTWKVMSDPGRP